MRRTARAAGWRAWRLAATRTQKVGFGTPSSRRKPKTRQKRAGCALQMPVRTRDPESHSTGPHVGELGFYFRGCVSPDAGVRLTARSDHQIQTGAPSPGIAGGAPGSDLSSSATAARCLRISIRVLGASIAMPLLGARRSPRKARPFVS